MIELVKAYINFYGIVTFVVFEAALSTPEESTLVTK
jgi:hypothetical protein